MGAGKIRKIILEPVDKTGYTIFGIASREPDYKLSLALNTAGKFSFRADTPVTVMMQNNKEIRFSRFSDLSAAPYEWASLISNRSENQFLVKKLINVDFLFIFMNESPGTGFPGKHLSGLREAGLITGYFPVDPDAIDTDILDLIPPYV